MLKTRICILILLFNAGNCVFAQVTNLVKYVNPISGTAASTTASALKHGTAEANFGSTIPSVCTPFAMTQWTPQTQASETKCIPPYYYKDDSFSGFRGSHWISGSCMQDYGSLTIMPISGKLKTTGYAAKFKHGDEQSTPYVYRLKLSSYKITAAITATPRCGMMEFTADAADSLYLLISPNSDYGEGFIKIDTGKGEIYGYNPVHRIYQGWGKPAGFDGYFVIKINKKLATGGTFSGERIFTTDSIAKQKNIGAFVGFKMQKGEKLFIKVGTSFSSLNGARNNLNAELPGWNFDITVEKCRQIWQQALSKIEVSTASETDRHIFYTSLYHAMQQPRMYNDADGFYPRFSADHQLDKITNGNYYDDFSLWDIYRAQIPLFEIFRPSLVNDLVQSLILKGEAGGWLPVFPCWNSYTSEMIGDHTVSVITSAYLKGITTTNIAEAYRLTRQNAFDSPAKQQDYEDGKGRRALQSYIKYGYIPLEDSVKAAFHKMEQVSRTIEYAYDDYALSQLAKKLGMDADYNVLIKRAGNYKNVFDPSTGFVRGRMENGAWINPFNPDARQSYITEGTPRQYTFYVPQDVPGLARLMGGRKTLETALDSLFIKKEYWHGNEPGHQIPFMYNFTANCWKTQKQVREILKNEYGDGPGGLGGNDDSGQMSAWYIFASMGFYPLNPISGDYLLCSPIFDKVVINLSQGRTLNIVTHKKSKNAQYITAVKWNGKTYSKNYVNYAGLIKGGRLDIYLQDTPCKNWAAKPENQPKGL
jgi:predicted alpha-1,2-mannosidase